MQIHFYTFSKRENSTRRPTGAAVTFDCNLKEPCSFITPDIVLQVQGNPTVCNYAYIPDFNRFYFVENWTYSRGFWSATLQVDTLASWREQIGASNLYILRCSAEYDGKVADTVYPTTADVTLQTTQVENPWKQTFDDGSYVVGIINGDSQNIGAVSYYVFTPHQFGALKLALMADTGWLGIPPEEIPEQALKVQFNPFQYIASVTWFPFDVSKQDYVAGLKFGWWTLDAVGASRIATTLAYIPITLPIPKHPQAAARGDYLSLSPYSRYTLNVRPFGSVPLDAAALADASSVYCPIYVDLITGDATMYVTPGADNNNVIAQTQAKVGVPVQLAQIARDYLGVAATSISAGTSAMGSFLKGKVTDGISTAVSGIASTIEAAMPQMQTSGGTGCISDFVKPPKLHAEFFNLVDENNDDLGRPLCKVRRISSIPGYIMVSHADISIPGTSEENRTIKTYLEGGFFYE